MESLVDENLMKRFVKWCGEKNIIISSSAEVTNQKCCHRFGMIAKHKINKSDLIFTIPRSASFSPTNCSLSVSLDTDILDSPSGWVKLLLALMYDYTDQSSKWRPYLDLFSAKESLDVPMYWTSKAREQLLSGIAIYDAVERDLKNIEEEYTNIALPFIKSNRHLGFDPKKHTLSLYEHLVGFVMAYSFTDPVIEETLMIPLADVLNHVALHNARVEFQKECFQIVAVRDIKKGEEIYNTYGQLSSTRSLQMYGFVEEHAKNVYESVDIPLHFIRNVQGMTEETMKKHSLDSITVASTGFLYADEVSDVLEDLTVDTKTFQKRRKIDELDRGLDCTGNVLSFKQIIQYKREWCPVLKTLIQEFCNYLKVLEEKKQKYVGNERRKNNVLMLLRNNIAILSTILDVLASA